MLQTFTLSVSAIIRIQRTVTFYVTLVFMSDLCCKHHGTVHCSTGTLRIIWTTVTNFGSIHYLCYDRDLYASTSGSLYCSTRHRPPAYFYVLTLISLDGVRWDCMGLLGCGAAIMLAPQPAALKVWDR
jgi:hypothetical protein